MNGFSVQYAFIEYVYPLFLSIGSSTDNFTVGASLGLSAKPLSFHVNLIISIANASGAYVSCVGGHFLERYLFQGVAPILSGIAFLYLAYDEYKSCSISLLDYLRSGASTTSTLQQKKQIQEEKGNAVTGLSDILRLAVPMTLNNLAGGVAGGAAGVQPVISGAMALIASFTMMDLGHKLGSRLGTSIDERIDAHIISSCIFVGLALLSFAECVL